MSPETAADVLEALATIRSALVAESAAHGNHGTSSRLTDIQLATIERIATEAAE